METTFDKYIKQVLNNFGFNQFSVLNIDDSNIDKINGISSKIVYSKKEYSNSDDFMKLKSDYIISLIETYYPVSVISFDSTNNLSGISHYAIVKKLPLDFIQVLFVTTSSILNDISRLNTPDQRHLRNSNLRPHVSLITGQWVWHPEYLYSYRTLVQLSCKKGFFGEVCNSSAYLEILKPHDYENNTIVHLYYEGILINKHIFAYGEGDRSDFIKNVFLVLKPYTTDLEPFHPLDFKKELTVEYIEKFNQFIATIEDMRTI